MGLASATYHVGIGSPNTKKRQTQTGGTFNGYAAGMYQQTTDNLTVTMTSPSAC